MYREYIIFWSFSLKKKAQVHKFWRDNIFDNLFPKKESKFAWTFCRIYATRISL